MKILVVDDEKTLVKGMKFNLENEGYEVECAYDGASALELAREGRFDLILLDVMMPEMDGLEACMKIREFSNVPIIMLTAKSEDADKLMGFECGADDYLTKPFNILELKARVRALLRRAAGVRLLPRVLLPALLLLGIAAFGFFSCLLLRLFLRSARGFFPLTARLFGGTAALFLGGALRGFRRLLRFGLRVVAAGRALGFPDRDIRTAFIAETQREPPFNNIVFLIQYSALPLRLQGRPSG